MKLRISESLSLPLATVTSTLVTYGGKGMGKTNFASVLAEELAAARQRFSAIDPMGVWWGLRHSKDGKGKGVECLILGGVHGDIPIEPTGGAVAADLVVDEDVNVIIDISRRPNGETWGVGEKIRFVTEYGSRLFQRQGGLVNGKRREPLFQILDEAARFIPQMIRAGQPELAMCLSVWAQMVEEGRNFGLGVGLFTQRSARLNKDVAELADAMVAFRTVGPNSIDAVMDWMGEHVPKQHIKDLVEKLRSLPVGSCLVISPGWLEVEKIVHIRMRETFDSSATPKAGESVKRVTGEAAKPDLAKYAARMQETIERVKANDPKELKLKLAAVTKELEKERLKKPAITQTSAPAAKGIDQATVKRMVTEVVKKTLDVRDEQWMRATQEYQGRWERSLSESLKRLDGALHTVNFTVPPKIKSIDTRVDIATVDLKPAIAPSLAMQSYEFVKGLSEKPRSFRGKVPTNGDSKLSGTARKILGVLCQWPEGMPEGMLAAQLGMKARGGHWTNLKSELNKNQFIVKNGKHLKASEAGREYMGDDLPTTPTTTEEVLEVWKPVLSEKAWTMASVLVERNGEPISREDLAEAVGLQAKGGHRTNLLSEIRTANLMVDAGKGMVAANKQVFLMEAA